MTYKRRYKIPDFNRSFLGILGDNLDKKANISRLESVDAIPNVYGYLWSFIVILTIIKGFPNSGTDLIIKENPIKPKITNKIKAEKRTSAI